MCPVSGVTVGCPIFHILPKGTAKTLEPTSSFKASCLLGEKLSRIPSLRHCVRTFTLGSYVLIQNLFYR